MRELKQLQTSAAQLRDKPARIAQRIHQEHATTRRGVAVAQIRTIPVARLKETTSGLRIDALERAGYKTLDQVLACGVGHLMTIPNVGEATASKAIATAHKVQGAAEEAAKIRIDLEKRPADGVWEGYKANAAELLALLEEVTGTGMGEEASHSELPAQIVERVRDQPLDLTFLTASLRGYQAFGAKVALAQRRTIHGD